MQQAGKQLSLFCFVKLIINQELKNHQQVGTDFKCLKFRQTRFF